MVSPSHRNPEDPDHTIKALQDHRVAIADLGHSVDRVADAVMGQATAEGEQTRELVHTLTKKVHVLAQLMKLMSAAVLILVVLLVVSVRLMASVTDTQQTQLDNQRTSRAVLLANSDTLQESNLATKRLFDCLDPSGQCYQEAIAQLECNQGGFCEPGMTPRPRIPVSTTSTTSTTSAPPQP